ALLVIACKGGPSLLDDHVEVELPSSSFTSGADKDQPKRAPLTPAKLAPIISELGAEGVNPSAIVISFSTPIIERDESGRVTSKSVLEIEPKVPGSLTYLGTSQLRFTPSQGFE